MTHSFSIEEALRFGWHKTREHSSLVFQVVLTILALQVATSVVQNTIGQTPLGILAIIVLSVLGVFLGAGAMHIALKLAHGTHAHYRDIMPPFTLVWPYFLSGLLAGLATLAGLILLVIPGIYLALRFSMARFAVLEGARPVESLRKSTHITRGHRWHLLGFFLVLALLNIVGAILLLVGLLITLPVSAFAYAHVYLKLKGHHAG